MSVFFAFFPIAFVKGASEPGSGVFTMTFTSTEIVHISLCYMQWPSIMDSSFHPSCVFHPHPYNFTIHPEYPTKIGRPLKNIQSDLITVSLNITDNKGGAFTL
ncbi:hypothetical protein OESDEN_11760 [Oesophagostomum dentatum]|uniref:Uncharacterized protein n=1 Tax=Oesophagostomum dentatum TaxID=61180 RepID=A0A0B1SWZ9_OESDE|nr:hypothetical protein OESDEN_11760 [Oesophagostomum dentatum]